MQQVAHEGRHKFLMILVTEPEGNSTLEDLGTDGKATLRRLVRLLRNNV
jgi:hypothetical protein